MDSRLTVNSIQHCEISINQWASGDKFQLRKLPLIRKGASYQYVADPFQHAGRKDALQGIKYTDVRTIPRPGVEPGPLRCFRKQLLCHVKAKYPSRWTIEDMLVHKHFDDIKLTNSPLSNGRFGAAQGRRWIKSCKMENRSDFPVITCLILRTFRSSIYFRLRSCHDSDFVLKATFSVLYD